MTKGLSNTQRTLRWLRQQGMIAGIVERFNAHAGPFGLRQDLFGFIDIVALEANSIIAIQSCGQAFSEHNLKILANEVAPEWLKSGGRIQLIGWRKIKKVRGGKQMIWAPRVKEYKSEDFNSIDETDTQEEFALQQPGLSMLGLR